MYPTRLRSHSSPARPRPNPDRPAVPAVPSPASPPLKPKSRPLTLFAPTAQLARKLTPRRKKSVTPGPGGPSPALSPPARPPRHPARPPARPSTSSGIPHSPNMPAPNRPSSSSGDRRPLMVWDVITPGGASITPFASFTDLRSTNNFSRRKPSVQKPKPPVADTDAISRSSTTETKSRSSNATSFSDHSMKSNNNLSTPDRAILQELKRTIAARDAQFVTRAGKKHHPYSPKVVPYPRSYERQVVDYDVWEGQFVQQVCGSVTWHVFDTPPTKVLDIGCGTGTWVLECAKTWKKCHFVGLDIVPLHPDLHQVGSSDLASRITWVQANFLEGLPFPNEEFDFVHIKRIARGVPEDKWDPLFEEISRVMKPGGAFEIIEEDLYFPGAPRDGPPPDSKQPSTPLSQTDPAWSHSPRPQGQFSRAHDTSTPMCAPSSSANGVPFDTGVNHKIAGDAVAQPSFQSELPQGFPRPALDEHHNNVSAARPRATSFREGPEGHLHHEHDLVRTSPKAPANPRDHSLLETIYSETHSSRFINLAPLSLLGNSLSLHFKDIRTHPPIIVSFPPPIGSLEKEDPRRPRPDYDDIDLGSSASSDTATSTTTTDSDADSDVLDKIDRRALQAALRRRRARNSSSANNRLSTYLSTEEIVRRTQPYVNLDSARRIALAPSSRATILVSDDPEHPSLFSQLNPPSSSSSSALHNRGAAREGCNDDSTPSDSAIDLSTTLGFQFKFDPPFSSSTANLSRRSQMPNKTFNFDLQSLNLHLAARVAEIVACSESMWAWLAEYQASAKDATVRQGSRSDDHVKQALLSLTRTDFDNLVTQFELDMSDYTMLGRLLEQRCDWPIPSMQRTQARKAFDTACKTWSDHRKQLARQRQRVHSTTHAPSSSHLDHIHSEPHDVRRSKSNASKRPRRPSTARSTMYAPSSRVDSPQPEPAGDDPSQRLSRTIRVFVAWKP